MDQEIRYPFLDPVTLLELFGGQSVGFLDEESFAEAQHHDPVGHFERLGGVLLGQDDADASYLVDLPNSVEKHVHV